MLVRAPETVDLSMAPCDGQERRGSGLTRDASPTGATYSQSGVFGDAPLATREKGERIREHWVATVLLEIEALRAATPPQSR